MIETLGPTAHDDRMEQSYLAGSKRIYGTLARELSRTELFLGITAVGVLVLVLAIPRQILVDIIALAVDRDTTLTLALFVLVVLVAVAAVGIGFGIGLENSAERPGRPAILYRHRRGNHRKHRA